MRPSVQHTADFDRIVALPRRELRLADAEEWADLLTERYAIQPGARLRPWQAYACGEAWDNRGAWLALPVGFGKTLISYILPSMFEAQRPVLIVPGRGLVNKTGADYAGYRGVWQSPPSPIRVVTLESLAPERGARWLDDLSPDLIMVDECDTLSNYDSSAVRRIERYVLARDGATAFVAMTGTPSRNSIMGYWHILRLALGNGAPVPLKRSEAQLWAAAIDAKASSGMRRPGPGPLGRTLEAARSWYRKRLADTPGVMVIDGDSCDAPLTIRARLARDDAATDEHFRMFAVDQTLPGGIPVADPLSRYRFDAQLGSGFYQYYDPAPPAWWVELRRAVDAIVRAVIERSRWSRNPLDTDAQVKRALRDHPTIAEWREKKDTVKLTTRVRWFSSAAVESAAQWVREQPNPGIIWVGSVEFGHALSAATRLAYYGRKGTDASGHGLHAAPANKSLIASWYANKRGFNLQPWRRQLICQLSPSAKYFEQIVGRSHRSGQRDRVTVDVLATSGGTLDAFESLIDEANFARATVGLTQKVLRADIVRAYPDVTASNKYRWAQREE